MSGKRILDSADNAMITEYRGIRSLYLHANKNLVPMIEKEADNYIEKCNELINIMPLLGILGKDKSLEYN